MVSRCAPAACSTGVRSWVLCSRMPHIAQTNRLHVAQKTSSALSVWIRHLGGGAPAAEPPPPACTGADAKCSLIGTQVWSFFLACWCAVLWQPSHKNGVFAHCAQNFVASPSQTSHGGTACSAAPPLAARITTMSSSSSLTGVVDSVLQFIQGVGMYSIGSFPFPFPFPFPFCCASASAVRAHPLQMRHMHGSITAFLSSAPPYPA